MATDSQTLFEQAKCYLCYGISEAQALELALLAQIAANVGPAPVAPNVPTNLDVTLASTNGNTILTWSNSDIPGTNEVWFSTDGVTYNLLTTVAGGVHTYTDPAVLALNGFRYYKVRSCNGAACSVFTSDVSVAGGINVGGGGYLGVSLSYPTLKMCYGVLDFHSSPNLVTASFPVLRKVFSVMTGNGCPVLTTVTITSLVTSSIISITNTALTAFAAPALTSSSSISLTSNSALVSVTANALSNCIGTIDASGNSTVTTFSMNALANLSGALFLGSTNIVTLSLNLLTGTGADIQAQSNPSLVTFSMAALVTCGGNLVVSDCPALTTVTLTLLAHVINGGRFDFSNSISLVTLSAPALIDVGDSIVAPGSTISTLNLPNLVDIGTNLDFDSCTNLATVNVPNINFPDGNTINFPTCALNQASVDLILARGVASGTNSSDYEMDGGTSSPPSAAGNINKGLLLGSGNTVHTN